ncbi:hypothetical protein CsatA_022239 [Cannabis sativa]
MCNYKSSSLNLFVFVFGLIIIISSYIQCYEGRNILMIIPSENHDEKMIIKDHNTHNHHHHHLVLEDQTNEEKLSSSTSPKSYQVVLRSVPSPGVGN